MHKHKIVCLLIFYFLLANSSAQETTMVDSLVKNLRLNFAVPDLPAFNALETDFGSILRPSTPKDFAFIANEFFNGSNIIIPKTLAIELAPITIMRYNKLTLRDYQKNPVLYNSRVSVGTNHVENNISKISVGFRTSLINKGDIKSEKNLVEIMDFLKDINRSRDEYYSKRLKELGKTELDFATDTELQEELTASFTKINKDKKDSLQNLIDGYKENRYWNAEKLDIAFSVVGTSPDSLAKNIKYSSLQFWTTYATPIGVNGQFLIGGHANLYKYEGSNYADISLPARVYIGTNKFKGFVEGQYQFKNRDDVNTMIFKLGCEYNLYEGFWLDFTAGFYKDITNKRSDFVSDFKLIYAIPGNVE